MVDTTKINNNPLNPCLFIKLDNINYNELSI